MKLSLLFTLSLLSLATYAAEPSGRAETNTFCTYTLSKHEFVSAGRTSFTLDVNPKRTDTVVTALCELHDEQQGIGRFPLGNVNSNVADSPVRFLVVCLANAYIDKTKIRVEIRDEKTKKNVGVLELSLRDAVAKTAK